MSSLAFEAQHMSAIKTGVVLVVPESDWPPEEIPQVRI
jgi:hypothetical protein